MKSGINLKYHSQYGQDRFLDTEIFKGKENGFFIEIGAYDGIRFSNSLFFEKERKWKGICIEPIPARYEELKKNRNSINVNACVSSKSGFVEFTMIEGYAEMLSGISKDYHKKHKNRIDENIKFHGGNKTTIKVESVTLNELLISNDVTMVDYCSIDTEGSELELLSSFDFSKFEVKAFSVENNYSDSKIRDLMKKNNYELIKTIECDEIYILK